MAQRCNTPILWSSSLLLVQSRPDAFKAIIVLMKCLTLMWSHAYTRSCMRQSSLLFTAYSLHALFCLLITLANSMDPDQAARQVDPDLDPSYLAHSFIFLFSSNFNCRLKKRPEYYIKLLSMQRVNSGYFS